ncbi:cell division protein FtsQ/DivIB [Thermophilibacter mediterraneus]|uniref:cell division protein FtsQ/DivIB n=1 Tax=Thermophilibacter mediterraneus TaxID=1871031 RepID=UPI0023549229|nr:FtsQ-type POTRA domain-containing protein [Thermophilibacter mediterraneus]
MARDDGRRPTRRQRTPLSAPPSGPAPRNQARRTLRPAPKPKLKAPRPARPSGPAPSRPAPRPKASPRPRAASRPPAASPARAAAVGGVATAAGSIGRALGRARGGAPARDGRERRQRHQRGQALRLVLVGAGAVAALLLVTAVALFALRDSSVFSIDSVEVEPTAHVTEQDIQNLVKVPAGSTLLNVDLSSIEQALKRDPWVAGVDFERVLPHTLRMTIREQAVDALVVMSSGSIAWYLGDAGAWIQPTSVEAAEGQSVNDAALAQALSDGCLLITDVPATVSPVAGSEATDGVLAAVEAFREGFSDDFASQIVSFSAPSEDAITCTLQSGVEVLLGAPTDISTKQALVERILAEQPSGSVFYIDVHVPTEKGASFRSVGSETVQEGSGVVSSSGADATSEGSDGSSADGSSGSAEGDASGDAATGSDGASADGQSSDGSGTPSEG